MTEHDEEEPDIVTAMTMNEVQLYVKQSRHYIAVKDPKIAKLVKSKMSTLGYLRKASTLAVVAILASYLVGRFLPDNTPQVLRNTSTKSAMGVGVMGAVGTQFVVNSSPFFCYEIVYSRKDGTMHLIHKEQA